MRIDRVTLHSDDLAAHTEFYRDRLGFAVGDTTDGPDITIGGSTLAMRPGRVPEAARGHHLAFRIPARKMPRAAEWLAQRAELLPHDGATVLGGLQHWNSTSVYFRGPDGSVLEFIGRRDLDEVDHPRAGTPDDDFGVADVLDISEVGVPSADPHRLATRLHDSLGLPAFGPSGPQFVPVGDQHGLLILTHVDRVWFPTEATLPATERLAVRLRAPKQGALALTEYCTITADSAGLPAYLGPHPVSV